MAKRTTERVIVLRKGDVIHREGYCLTVRKGRAQVVIEADAEIKYRYVPAARLSKNNLPTQGG